MLATQPRTAAETWPAASTSTRHRVFSVHPKRAGNPNAHCPRVRSKELGALIAAAWAAGWWCEATKKGHVRCYSPDQVRMVLVAGTPSDHRAIANTRSTFRRAGLNV
jgi:hypothetical protein